MHCPNPDCHSERIALVRSIPHAPMRSWPRHRRCLDCGTEFDTVEKITSVRVRGPKPGSPVRIVPIEEYRTEGTP
ncbi:MAG: hypothetical protein LCH53_13555 [Bacteroidetes bacterium]|nr:hypothetical protein [Bacteroidota bacterium]